MRQAGYVTAADAAEAIGVDNVGTIHRMVKSEKLRGARAGYQWYVSVRSLLAAYVDAPPILARIQALGVAPKDEIEVPATTAPAKTKTPKGKRNGRRAS